MDLRIPLIRYALKSADERRIRRLSFHYPAVRLRPCTVSVPWGPSVATDVFSAAKASLAPLVIDLHGGGLIYGTHRLNRWSNAELSQRGFTVVSLDYPLIPHVSLKDQIRSVLWSVQQLLQRKDLRWDRRNLFFKGDSGGALLAALCCAIGGDEPLAALFDVPKQSILRGLAMIHPMVNTRRLGILGFLDRHLVPEKELGGACHQTLLNPLSLLPLLPPVFLVTSKNDWMFHRESAILAQELKRQNIPHVFKNHAFRWRKPLNHVFMITHTHLPESQILYEELAAIFHQLTRRPHDKKSIDLSSLSGGLCLLEP
ncbi:hypothetical protein ABB02_01522 [Clostridiaceae bacterium JG1575]|nr:hypothetical protein ABB02_01522 [Clostridiaceae bacterium JG1575]